MCILYWRLFCEWKFFCFVTESFPIVHGSCCLIFRINWISFLSILSEKLEESFVSSNCYHSELERVPCFAEERLHIALEHWVLFLMFFRTFATDVSTERHVAVRTFVTLTIDAECIELVLLDLFSQECGGVGSLWVGIDLC